MSTRTWTFIKPEYLTREQKTKLLERALDNVGGVYYGNYRKKGWDYALSEWLQHHQINYDYYVKMFGMPESHMTTEYLTKDLREKIDICREKEEYYRRCLSGNMSFREMLGEIRKIEKNGKANDFLCIDRQNDVYVHIPHEWWRNYQHSDDEFCTVDSLIEEVRKSTSLVYYEDKIRMSTELHGLTPSLERDLREYYGNIGDNNFYVHFG